MLRCEEKRHRGHGRKGVVPLSAAAFLAAVLGLLATGSVWAEETSLDSGSAAYSQYLSEVEDNVVLAGALDLNVLRASHQGTIRVVDLRTEGEGAPEEAAAAEALGIHYTNIPVSSPAIEADQVAALREALAPADANDLVVVHCRSGNRAGLLYGATQLEAGVPLDQVKENVSGIVTMAPINEGLESYAKKLDAGL